MNDSEIEIKVTEVGAEVPAGAGVDGVRVQKILDLMSEGKSFQAATLAAGGSPSLFKRADIQKLVREAIEAGHFTADVVRAAVRSGTMVTAMKALESGLKDNDPKMLKIALEAFSQMAGDPAVGLKTQPKTEVTIDFGAIAEMMGKTALSPEEVIIDVDTEKDDSAR